MEKKGNSRRKWLSAIAILCVLAVIAAGVLAMGMLYQKVKLLYEHVAGLAESTDEYVKRIDWKTPWPEHLEYDLEEPYVFDYSWVDQQPPLVAHAMGSVDGKNYTNSREAFEYNYSMGHRVFEVDFDLTDSDFVLICSHDADTWRNYCGLSADEAYSYDTFMNTPVLGAYTPMDYRDVVQLLVKYPDAYIVADTKYTDFPRVHIAFTQLTDYAKMVDPSVMDRIIPQIYHEKMVGWVMDIYPFRSMILTLYQTQWNENEVYKFCADSGIRFVTIKDVYVESGIIDLWKQLGIRVAVHTINDVNTANQLREMGVDMLYTDWLTPSEM